MWRKILWFVLITTLGNIAMAIYVLVQLSKWKQADGVSALLMRSER